MTEHLCKHGNYHCMICEVNLLKKVIEDYQKENEIMRFCLNDVANIPNGGFTMITINESTRLNPAEMKCSCNAVVSFVLHHDFLEGNCQCGKQYQIKVNHHLWNCCSTPVNPQKEKVDYGDGKNFQKLAILLTHAEVEEINFIETVNARQEMMDALPNNLLSLEAVEVKALCRQAIDQTLQRYLVTDDKQLTETKIKKAMRL